MRRTLERVEEITLLWKKAQISYKAYRRAVFVLWTMREFPEIHSALDLQMERIQMIRKHANEAGVNLSDTAIKSLIEAFHKAFHKEGVIGDKSHSKAEETSKRTREALKNSGIDSTSDNPQARLTKEQKLKQVLKQQGLSDNEVQKMIDQYKLELERKPNIKPSTPEPADKTDVETDSNYGCEILVVGSGQGAFGIVAQAYLELVRVWTVNCGGPWIFARVDSAGLLIDSAFRRGPGKLAGDKKLTPGGGSCAVWALQALFKDKNYFRTDDYPNEKQSIFERVKAKKARGIREEDFTRYDYILCSGEWALEQLRKLSEISQKEHPNEPNKSKILNIRKPGTTTEYQSADGIVKGGRDAVKYFLGSTLSWTRPAGPISNGPDRTLLFCIQGGQGGGILLRYKAAARKKLETKTKCKIHMAWQSKDLGWVVAVVGRKETLKEAQDSILKYIAHPN